MPLKLKGFKPGANLTIVNTYSRRFSDEKGKYLELLTLIYRDLDTMEKHKEEIIDPERTFWIVNPEKRVSYNRLFVPVEDTHTITCVNKDTDKETAKELGLKSWYSDCIYSGNRDEARLIQQHPDVLGSDVNIEDYYRFEFGNTYQNNSYDPTKVYFDIEVDGKYMAGDFPEMGECPVNAISIVVPEARKVYTLLLKNHENPLIDEFEQFVEEDKCREFKEFLRDHIDKGGVGNFEKYKLNEFSFDIMFYDEDKEINLITDLFKIINTYKPDFALAWNMAFDIPYLIARIQALGYKPEDIMCHPDFKYKIVSYYIDERNKNDYPERGDFAIISSYTVYIDQMIQYASRRKGQSRPLSYGLDFIANVVAKVHKLDYKDITTNIMEFPYKNFKMFTYYNIIDTIAQYCTESVANDIDYVFGKAIMNNTRYSKVHRQTVYLANRGRKEFFKEGFIMGNNSNRNNEKPKDKFPGAFVADPSKVSNYSRSTINGRPIDVFANNDDFDYCIVA